MFYKTGWEIRDRIEYDKFPDGTWRAEFHGFADISVQEKTLQRCQNKILDEIDTALAPYVTRKAAPEPKVAASQRRRR